MRDCCHHCDGKVPPFTASGCIACSTQVRLKVLMEAVTGEKYTEEAAMTMAQFRRVVEKATKAREAAR
jgi:hypothetical protein